MNERGSEESVEEVLLSFNSPEPPKRQWLRIMRVGK